MNPDHLKRDKRGKIMVNSNETSFDFATLGSKIEGSQIDQGSLPTVTIATQSDSSESKTVHYIDETKVGFTESQEKMITTEDKKPAARTHNTRGRNGIKKQRIEVYSPDNGQERNGGEDAFLNSCAASLAALDRRACARAIVKDASAILEEVLLPMSFPWAHPTAPFMRIPRDIEDMPEIQGGGYEGPEHEVHGKFETSNVRGQPSIKLASRRAYDPGVIEFTRFTETSQVQKRSFNPLKHTDISKAISDEPGELSLRIVEDVQNRKAIRREIEARNVKACNVSIRLGCTSSKSTVFDNVDEGRMPLVIPAMMPRVVQEGKRKGGDSAYLEAKELGSYNCRQTQISPSCSKAARPRTWVGRTRLIWSEQDQLSGTSQRGHYKSILTGERLENNAHKRPIHVKVGVQIEGRILSTRKGTMRKMSPALDAALQSNDPDHVFSYTQKVINEALDRSFAGTLDTRDHSQCSLNIEKFHSTIKDDFESEHKTHFVEEILKLYEVNANFEDQKFLFSMIPPRLDCTATEDGIVSVACSILGKFQWQGPDGYSTENVILEKICSRLQLCQGCFASLETTDRSKPLYCSSCKSLDRWGRHQAQKPAQQSDTILSEQSEDKYKRSSRVCSICGLGCGSLIQEDQTELWCHDICRIWAGHADNSHCSEYEGVCSFCSSGSSTVVRCASENCDVRFHPMCAIIASKTAQMHKTRFERSNLHGDDAYLCTQYELSILQASIPTGIDPVFGKATFVPVAFCGYHNPKRSIDHFSLYPGCSYLENSMRIPPRREVRR